jgi:UDP-N-acetylmuramoylalanine--D-glutamate ligase
VIRSDFFKGRKYAVLGLARSGLTAVSTLVESGAQVTAWDREAEARAALDARVEVADPLEIDLSDFSGIVVSPGVPINSHPIAHRAARAGVPLIGDIELFALARAHLPAHRVVGITGTNGKSTVTALVHHVCQTAGLESRMGGNIGLPILAEEPLGKGGVYVLELSSYQIDLTRSLQCEVAALTNVTPDHLDRYAGFDDYAFAKARLFALQGVNQFAVLGCSEDVGRSIANAERSRRPAGRVVCADREGLNAMQAGWPGLQGPHNLENAAIAREVARELGIADDATYRAFASFRGLPHRMERLGQIAGVEYVNDSKATNPASAAPALAAFPPSEDGKPRIHWICGGLAKTDDLGECAEYLGNVATAYTIGESAQMFADLLCGRVPGVERCEMLHEAVRRAANMARPGDVVLLSPACASFDQFRDFEQRGEAFRSSVDSLRMAQGDAPRTAAGGERA